MTRTLRNTLAVVLSASWIALFGTAAFAGAGGAQAQDPKSILDRIYSEAQAQRGEQRFKSTCSSCHAVRDFVGGAFADRWDGSSMGDVFEWVSVNMPDNDPGGLKPEDYANVLAYILSINGYPIGTEDMPASKDALKKYAIVSNPK